MANFKISDIVSVVATPASTSLLEIEEGGVSGQTTVGGLIGIAIGAHVAYAGGVATHTLTTGMANQISSNIGASGIKTLQLPAATVGLRYGALRSANYALRFEPSGSETIGDGAAGKYMELTSRGVAWIQCFEAGKWEPVSGTALTAYEA
jgi:hypothetical protein